MLSKNTIHTRGVTIWLRKLQRNTNTKSNFKFICNISPKVITEYKLCHSISPIVIRLRTTCNLCVLRQINIESIWNITFLLNSHSSSVTLIDINILTLLLLNVSAGCYNITATVKYIICNATPIAIVECNLCRSTSPIVIK